MVDVLTETGIALVDPLVRLWNSIVDVLPGLIAAIVILVIGYIIAMVIGGIVRRLSVKLKLDKWALEKTNLKSIMGKFNLSDFFGLIVKWLVFVAFLPQAAELIKLQGLSMILIQIARWVPDLIWAIVIAMAGFVAAEYVSKRIIETKARGAKIIAGVLKVVILVVVAITALGQIGVDISFAENSFLIVLSGIMLALGLGFGLAMKDDAQSAIKLIRKKF